MIYDQKINWRSRQSHGSKSVQRMIRSRLLILDYQIGMEADINDLINYHFKDPDMYEVERAPLQIRIQIVRALIGPTPDDGVWEIVDRFSKLRNSFAHSTAAYTADGIRKAEDQTRAVLKSLQKVRPEFTDAAATDRTWIIGWAALTVQGFFREIRRGLSRNALGRSNEGSGDQSACEQSEEQRSRDFGCSQ
jgi:hypothetical protein